MSRVTNLIVAFSTLEDEAKVIDRMRDYNDGKFIIVSVIDEKLPSDWYGGTKRLECSLLIGAYNYLDLEGFLLFLRSEINWEAIDLVQLFVKEQDNMKFKLINLIDE